MSVEHRFTVQIKTYLDNNQRHIQHKEVVEGELPAGLCPFRGFAVAMMPSKTEKDGEPQQKSFDIPGATTIPEAYELYDTFWKQTLSKIGALSGMPEPTPVSFIVRIDQYQDNLLQRVVEHVCVSGATPPKFPKFHGMGDVEISGQILPQDFILDGAETIADAYKAYPAVFSEVGRRVQTQMEQYLARAQEQMEKQQKSEHQSRMDAIKATRAGKAKKLILPEDKTGRNGPLSSKK